MNEESLARRFLPVALLLVTSAAYAPSLTGTFQWDDKSLILKNPYIRSFKHLRRNLSSAFWNVKPSGGGDLRANVYFRPLVTLSYMVDHAIYGVQPWGYHLTNVLLHSLAVLMVYWLAIRIFAAPWLAFAAALIFALHPSRTEVVAWISGRTGSMMTIFYLASLLLFWRYLSGEGARKRTLFLAWLAYLFAMVCKETAISLVVAVIGLDYLIVNASGGESDTFRRKHNLRWCHLPLVGATGLFLVFRVFYQGGVLSDRPSTGLWPRITMFLESIGQYGALTVNPYDPSLQVTAFYHPARPDWVMVGAGAALLVAFCAGLYWALKKRSAMGRGVAWAMVLTMSAVAPVSNLVPLSLRTLVSERFLYLPLLGLALMVGFGLKAARSGLRHILVAVVVLLTLSWATVDALRSREYASELTLWLSTARTSPDNPLAEQNIALALVRAGRYDEADTWFAKALKNWIRVQQAPEVIALQMAWLDVRLLRMTDRKGKFLEKLGNYLGTLSEMLDKPAGTVPAITLSLGKVSFFVEIKTERTRLLVRRKRTALYGLLGTVRSLTGADAQALAAFETALQAAPYDAGILLNATLAYARAFRIEQALQYYQRALQLLPEAGTVLTLGKTLREVKRRLKEISALDGLQDGEGRAAAERLKAEIYMLLRSPARAETHLRQAIALSPDDRQLRAALAMELAAGLELAKALEVIQYARQRFGAEAGIDQLEQQVRRIYQEEHAKRQ